MSEPKRFAGSPDAMEVRHFQAPNLNLGRTSGPPQQDKLALHGLVVNLNDDPLHQLQTQCNFHHRAKVPFFLSERAEKGYPVSSPRSPFVHSSPNVTSSGRAQHCRPSGLQLVDAVTAFSFLTLPLATVIMRG